MKNRPFLLIGSLIITLSVCSGTTEALPMSSDGENINNDTLENRDLIADDNKMIYPVYVYGSSVLREPTVEVGSDYSELEDLIENMFATMYNSEGVGIAAPQIGENIRLFVVDVPMAVGEGEEPKSFVKAFVNPKIYEYSQELCSMTEGCLSIPGLNADVVRSSTIRIKYCDENFVEYDEQFDGFIARVIQHEYDHLEGVLYTDRLDSQQKLELVSGLDSISNGSFSAEYKTVQKK